MQKLRIEKGEELKISKGPISTSAAESVSVPKQTDESVHHESRLPMIVVPFFLVVATAIGLVLYLHYTRVAKQKELYATYVKQNAWLDPINQQYEKLRPILLSFEMIDPTQPQDWKRINADLETFEKGAPLLRPASTLPRTDATIELGSDVDDLMKYYRNYVHGMRIPVSLRTNAKDRRLAVEYVGHDTRGDFLQVKLPADEQAYDLMDQAESKATSAARAMDDTTLSKKVAVIIGRTLPSQIRAAREYYERDLKNAIEVPEGLELKYARGLR